MNGKWVYVGGRRGGGGGGGAATFLILFSASIFHDRSLLICSVTCSRLENKFDVYVCSARKS